MNESREKIGRSACSPDWLDLVRQQVGSLRYGTVEIVVQDSRVIQIQKTERVRLDRTEPRGRSSQPGTLEA